MYTLLSLLPNSVLWYLLVMGPIERTLVFTLSFTLLLLLVLLPITIAIAFVIDKIKK